MGVGVCALGCEILSVCLCMPAYKSMCVRLSVVVCFRVNIVFNTIKP